MYYFGSPNDVGQDLPLLKKTKISFNLQYA